MKRLWILLILFCIIGILFETVCNGQTLHSNKVIDISYIHGDTIRRPHSVSLATIEYSNSENRLIIFYPRSKVVYKDCIYEKTNYGFLVETNDCVFEWYINSYMQKVLMIVEKPFIGAVDKRIWTKEPYNSITKKTIKL
jgi:hypothetical protein